MAHSPAVPPAYDFRDGCLRIWQGGEVVAVFAADRLPAITLDLVRQLQNLTRSNQLYSLKAITAEQE